MSVSGSDPSISVLEHLLYIVDFIRVLERRDSRLHSNTEKSSPVTV